MKRLLVPVFIVLLAVGMVEIFSKTEEGITKKIHEHTRNLNKHKISTMPGTFKPIENFLRKTAILCSSNLHLPTGYINSFHSDNLDFSTTAEPGNNPLNALKVNIKHSTRLRAFNDQWIRINTAKGLHNAARKDGRLDYVLKMSKRMHLPPAVAIVPIVESNYDNNDVSGKGAAGAWQLMPETARDYGIKLHERKQIAPATHAALHLLKDLYAKFNNWELAFAAYNAGGARVENALRKNPDAFSIEELDLPRETKDYISRLKKMNQLIKRFAHLEANIAHLINDFEY